MKQKVNCDRCGSYSDELIPHDYKDDDTGESKHKDLCWDCDFDIINGRGDYNDDMFEVQREHEEENYLADPINNKKPEWY